MIDLSGNATRLRRRWRWAAAAWLTLVLALGAHQISFWSTPRLDGDILALLPGEPGDPLLALANQRIADNATRQVVVVLRGANWDESLAAARAFTASLDAQQARLRPVTSEQGAAAALAFYRPFRDRLLTPAQRTQLQNANPDVLAEHALAALFGPSIAGTISAWQADPLALWPAWWQQRLGRNLGQRDGMTIAMDADGPWIVLPFVVDAAAFRLSSEAYLRSVLDRASASARTLAPTLSVLRAGVPLHAEAAAVRANWEVNTIGLGSLLAIVLLMWMVFRSVRPLALVSLSLAIGWAAGVSATALAFGNVHLLTLVFGASLLGVAEDYGIHYFASRQARGAMGSHALMRHLLPGLLLAWSTSAVAYLALGIAPFPGLRQMAVFSGVGLAAAFLTAVCWFPWLDRGLPPMNRFGRTIAGSLATWPRLRLQHRSTWWAIAALSVFTVPGLLRLDVRDDLRSLQSSPATLLTQQRQIDALLALPSPAQFYLVRGNSAEQVLQREEHLTARLDALVADATLSGYRATSGWVPSRSRQHADAQLTARLETLALRRASTAVGESVARPAFATTDLRVEDWLQQPLSMPFRPAWLGQTGDVWASVVMLDGIDARTDLALLQRQAAAVPGVRWVDRTADISQLLGHYRKMMGSLLLAGFALVALMLALRYRSLAWRAVLPTAVASLLTLAALAWLGEPLQLFTVLALLLLLGMGIDFGIFLLEHRGDGASWLAVSLGAASTLLAFGLLALSATPALHTFGLTLLLGISLVWLLSPLLRPLPVAVADRPAGASVPIESIHRD